MKFSILEFFHLSFRFIFLFQVCFVKRVDSDSFFFTAEPQDKEVREGKEFRLDCSVQPDDGVSYLWYRLLSDSATDRRQVNFNDEQDRVVERNHSLVVSHADRFLDDCFYQCRAVNVTSNFDTISKPAKVTVLALDPEVKVKLLEPKRVENILINQQVILRCETFANPPVKPDQIEWFFDMAKITEDAKRNMKIKKDGDLVIYKFGQLHRGIYHCSVTHGSGKFDSWPGLVLFPSQIDGERFDPDPSTMSFQIYAKKGETVQLKCPQSIEENTKTFWSRRRLLNLHSVPTMPAGVQITGDQRSITIQSFDPEEHTNFYICELEANKDFVFRLEEKRIILPHPNNFSPNLSPDSVITARFGKPLTIRYYQDYTKDAFTGLALSNISNPPPFISWYHHRSLIPTVQPSLSQKLNRYVDGGGRHLVIQKVTSQELGDYTVVFTNWAGNVSITFRLEALEEPQLTSEIYTQSIDEGEKLELSCGIKIENGLIRKPENSSILWTLNNRDIFLPHEQLTSVMYDSHTANLLINPTSYQHTGVFRCSVRVPPLKRDYVGNSYNIVVKNKLEFVEDLGNFKPIKVFLEEDTRNSIPCRIRGYGEILVKWYRNNDNPQNLLSSKIVIAPQVFPESLNGIDVPLDMLGTIKLQDNGIYKFKAQSHGNASKTIERTFEAVVGKRPVITRITEEQVIREGDGIYLDCLVDGSPKPTVEWHVTLGKMREAYSKHDENNNKLVYSYPQSTVPADGRNGANSIQISVNGSLSIRKSMYHDYGLYECVSVIEGSYMIQPIGDRKTIEVRVLNKEEFEAYQQEEVTRIEQEARVSKMVSIVVGCALLYLFLMCVLTAFCSLGMIRRKRGRNHSGPRCSSELNGTTLGVGSHFRRDNSLIVNANSGKTNYMSDNGNLLSHMHQGNGSLHPLLGNSNGIQNQLMTSYNSPLPNPVASNGSLMYVPPSGSTANSSIGPIVTSSQSQMQHFFEGTLTTAVTSSAGGQGLPSLSYQNVNTESLSGNDSTTTRDRLAIKELMQVGSNGSYAGLEPSTMNSSYWSSQKDFNNSLMLHTQVPITESSRSLVCRTSNPSSTSVSYGPPIQNYPRKELSMEFKLGEGEFGEVWLARGRFLKEGETESLVMVKALAIGADDIWMIHEFKRQTELFAVSKHDHLTGLLALCVQELPHLLIIDWCEWGDLKKFLVTTRSNSNQIGKGPQLNRNQKLAICNQVASGMDYLVSRRMVHRDLAARNVLLTKDLEVKVSLIGLCRDEYITEYYRPPRSERMFPLRWMAPETLEGCRPLLQNCGDKQVFDYSRYSRAFVSASDVWSFAVLSGEIFSHGNLPLARLTDCEILELAFPRFPTAGSQLRHELVPETPMELCGLLNRCLSHQPEYRPCFTEILTCLGGLIRSNNL